MHLQWLTTHYVHRLHLPEDRRPREQHTWRFLTSLLSVIERRCVELRRLPGARARLKRRKTYFGTDTPPGCPVGLQPPGTDKNSVLWACAPPIPRAVAHSHRSNSDVSAYIMGCTSCDRYIRLDFEDVSLAGPEESTSSAWPQANTHHRKCFRYASETFWTRVCGAVKEAWYVFIAVLHKWSLTLWVCYQEM